MKNFKNIIGSNLIECKIDVLYINRVIGNTIQNNFKISFLQDELDIIEIFAPDLTIEKFRGKCYNFACVLAIDLIAHYGTIQFAYVEKLKNSSNAVELVVYYSKTNRLDETTRNQMLFYHAQQNLDLEYLTLAEIIKDAKLHSSFDILSKNDTDTDTVTID